ncbi:MAG: helix-turn-helix domain-containing protein [Actinobacteria bacterium]|nr:helix-turn-helix domain-containing protein [Actinomycetota bacterium]
MSRREHLDPDPVRAGGDLEARRMAFGAALMRRRRELSLSQTDLGLALGGIGQSAISQWECGGVQPQRQHVFAAEEALSLTPGTLSQLLGYLPPSAPARTDPADVRKAIRRDPFLTEKEKRSFLCLYEAIVAGRKGPPRHS